ncbi:hypothetical protein [Bacillus toyonensis]|uniref:hypothetical protein n=1 Tax=Bacillus toyonensis TaxID=155322 RepID=UPI000BF0142F|nr:hypothetical protein [Bacillus toyonensis]PEM41871.1 hypothetical protein CN636_22190 [Bacillus toyonensis]
MIIFSYYFVVYFITVVLSINIVTYIGVNFELIENPNTIKILIFTLIVASLLSFIFSVVLHVIYAIKSSSEKFLKQFYIVHFLITYASGLLSLLIAGEKTFKEWGYSDLGFLAIGNTKVAWLMLLFIAISNNALYKVFENDIVKVVNFIFKKFNNFKNKVSV